MRFIGWTIITAGLIGLAIAVPVAWIVYAIIIGLAIVGNYTE